MKTPTYPSRNIVFAKPSLPGYHPFSYYSAYLPKDVAPIGSRTRISLYILLILLAYCVNISTYCVYRLSSVPFSAYRFSDLGAYHITRFIRITQILEMYCSISKIYRTCCRVLQTYCILGEKHPWNWGKTACHPDISTTPYTRAYPKLVKAVEVDQHVPVS